jgi:hypothetical protein
MATLYNSFSVATVIDSAADLVTTARKAALYDNSTNLATHGHFFLTVQYDASAPTAGGKVAELYLCPEDGNAVYPEGGDGTVGDDVDPQQNLLVGAFESRDPKTNATEVLCIPWVPLTPKFKLVLKNVSGKTFEGATPHYSITMKPLKYIAEA